MQLGPSAIFSLSVSAVVLAIGVMCTCISWYDVFIILRKFKCTLAARDVTITLVLSTIAATATVVWRIIWIIIISTPQWGVIVTKKKTKTHPLYSATTSNPAIALIYFCTLTSMLHVSILWWQVASATSKLQRHQSRIYIRWVFGCEFVFGTILAILVGFHQWAPSFLLSLPFVIGVMILLLVGRVKIVNILKGAMSRSTALSTKCSVDDSVYATSNSKASSIVTRTLRSINAIQTCCNCLLLCCVLYISIRIWFATVYTKFRSENGKRNFSPQARIGQYVVSLELLFLSMSLAQVFVVRFSHRNVKKRVANESHKASSNPIRAECSPESVTSSHVLEMAVDGN